MTTIQKSSLCTSLCADFCDGEVCKHPTVASLAQAHPLPQPVTTQILSVDETVGSAGGPRINFSKLRTVQETKKNLDDPSDVAFI
jgi:hypothetical protein